MINVNVKATQGSSLWEPATETTLRPKGGKKIDAECLDGYVINDYSDEDKALVDTIPTLTTEIDGKVDKVTGYGLSKNDYDDTEKASVATISGKANTTHTHAESDITNLSTDLAGKQGTLESGINIKTINGSSILGSGDLSVSASVASQAEAEAGTDNTKMMTPLRVAQEITARNLFDIPPASPSAYDDEFNSTTLNGKWAWLNQGTNVYSLTALPGSIQMQKKNESTNIRLLCQNRPTGDFTVTTKMLVEYCDAEAYTGIILINSSTGANLIAGVRSGLLGQTRFGNFQDGSPYTDAATYNSYGCYVWSKLVVTGTTVSCFYSANGVVWTPRAASIAVPTSFDKIGFGVHNGVTGRLCSVYFDWFRVTQ